MILEKKEIRKIFYYLMVKFPYSVCEKPVAINHEAVYCDVSMYQTAKQMGVASYHSL